MTFNQFILYHIKKFSRLSRNVFWNMFKTLSYHSHSIFIWRLSERDNYVVLVNFIIMSILLYVNYNPLVITNMIFIFGTTIPKTKTLPETHKSSFMSLIFFTYYYIFYPLLVTYYYYIYTTCVNYFVDDTKAFYTCNLRFHLHVTR